MKFSIRVYTDDHERHDSNNVKAFWLSDTPTRLVEIWLENEIEYEGSSYSIWDRGNNCFIGDVFDPGDLDYLCEYLGEHYPDEFDPASLEQMDAYKKWVNDYKETVNRIEKESKIQCGRN